MEELVVRGNNEMNDILESNNKPNMLHSLIKQRAKFGYSFPTRAIYQGRRSSSSPSNSKKKQC